MGCARLEVKEELQLQERREKDSAVPSSQAPGAIDTPLHHTRETATQHISLYPFPSMRVSFKYFNFVWCGPGGHGVIYSRLGALTS